VIGWLAAAAVAAAPVPEPWFCKAPRSDVDRMTCASPTLRAWAKASIVAQTPTKAHDRFFFLGLADDVHWPGALEACRTPACIRQAYVDWLDWLAQPAHEPIPLPHAPVLRANERRGEWTGLQVLPLGDGWTVFRLDNGYSRDGVQADRLAFAMVVAHVAGGRAEFRDEEGHGLDFQRLGPAAWRVREVGEARGLSGVYRRGRAK
jgi:hypothetical protein